MDAPPSRAPGMACEKPVARRAASRTCRLPASDTLSMPKWSIVPVDWLMPCSAYRAPVRAHRTWRGQMRIDTGDRREIDIVDRELAPMVSSITSGRVHGALVVQQYLAQTVRQVYVLVSG